MPGHCIDCGRKGTKSGSRTVHATTNKCNECVPNQTEETGAVKPPAGIDPESTLGELSFSKFTTRFKQELLDDIIQKKVDEATKELRKDLDKTKSSVKTANEDIAKFKTKIDQLTSSLKDVQEENVKVRNTSANNMKYLVNHDRNVRRKNVILFGVSETEDMVIDGASGKGDEDKIKRLFRYIGLGERMEMMNFVRLGKEQAERESPRPLKIELRNGEMASEIITNAKELKPLNMKIFFKPDKTLKEREEYQRLLNKKNELMISHPTEEGADNRVVLQKGVLTVDGVVTDR